MADLFSMLFHDPITVDCGNGIRLVLIDLGMGTRFRSQLWAELDLNCDCSIGFTTDSDCWCQNARFILQYQYELDNLTAAENLLENLHQAAHQISELSRETDWRHLRDFLASHWPQPIKRTRQRADMSAR